MKRVGLITYYGNNYGAILQAYALQQAVIGIGYECELISNDFLYQSSKASESKHKWDSISALIKNPVGYLLRRKVYRKYANQIANKSSFDEFKKRYLFIKETGYRAYEEYTNNPPQYDIYLCGSDQIWNPNLYSDNSFYFAGFAPDESLKVAYASSMGVSSLTKAQAEFMAPLLNRFQVISTREQTCAETVNKISTKKAKVVLDPTLLINAEKWSEIAAPCKINKPYVFCYLFGERDYYNSIKKLVREMTGMELVCIPFVARELSSNDEKIFNAGPADFISLIKNASLVLTDSFHATAFSINLRVPFISLCRFKKDDKKSMNDRLVSLLNLVELKDRLFDEGDILTQETLYSINFDKAYRLLNNKRREDTQFLIDSLNYSEEVLT